MVLPLATDRKNTAEESKAASIGGNHERRESTLLYGTVLLMLHGYLFLSGGYEITTPRKCGHAASCFAPFRASCTLLLQKMLRFSTRSRRGEIKRLLMAHMLTKARKHDNISPFFCVSNSRRKYSQHLLRGQHSHISLTTKKNQQCYSIRKTPAINIG